MKKKMALVLAVPATLACVAAGPAFAGQGMEYAEQPGYAVANGNTPCADHGAFGFWGGRDHNLKGGADDRNTGPRNSSLCGNPQGH